MVSLHLDLLVDGGRDIAASGRVSLGRIDCVIRRLLVVDWTPIVWGRGL